jgi:hypothetical protein
LNFLSKVFNVYNINFNPMCNRARFNWAGVLLLIRRAGGSRTLHAVAAAHAKQEALQSKLQAKAAKTAAQQQQTAMQTAAAAALANVLLERDMPAAGDSYSNGSYSNGSASNGTGSNDSGSNRRYSAIPEGSQQLLQRRVSTVTSNRRASTVASSNASAAAVDADNTTSSSNSGNDGVTNQTVTDSAVTEPTVTGAAVTDSVQSVSADVAQLVQQLRRTRAEVLTAVDSMLSAVEGLDSRLQALQQQ